MTQPGLSQDLREKASILAFVFVAVGPIVLFLSVVRASPDAAFVVCFMATVGAATAWRAFKFLTKKIAERPRQEEPERDSARGIVFVPMDLPVPNGIYRLAVRKAQDEEQIRLVMPPPRTKKQREEEEERRMAAV